MNDTVQLVAQKNHEDNIDKFNIPEKVLPYLNINVIQLIASKISKLTKQTFTYYGNLKQLDDSTIITLKSREGNSVDISITHDLVFEDGHDKGGENIIFDGLTKLLNRNIDLSDDFVENSDAPDSFVQEQKVSPEKLDKIIEGLTKFTEKQKEDHETQKQAKMQKKRKRIIMEKLGIETEEEEEQVDELQSEKAQALSNLLDGLEDQFQPKKEEVVEEKEPSEKAEKMSEFLDALANINKNDIQKEKQKANLNRVRKHLDKLDEGS